tara:strand:+ start:253 stop:549 length:297 start_codon:yes stop_codon:yes gene_type:complete
MKNLFCALAFMLIGTFAFANNGVEKHTTIAIEKYSEITIDFEKIVTNYEKKENEKENTQEDESDCIPVTFCGTKGFLCGYNSMEQFFDWFWYYNDLLC